jgi:hypothetical protein
MSMAEDIDSDPRGFYPATKNKILATMSDYSGGDTSFVENLLPEGSYSSSSEFVAALIEKSPPIEWKPSSPVEFMWKYNTQSLPFGQRLSIGEGQSVVLVSKKDGIACDELVEKGIVILSGSTTPELASRSRKPVPSFRYGALDGYPVFLSSGREIEIDLSVMGKTRSLRRVMVRGVARVKVASPKPFVEKFAPRLSGDISEQVISGLNKNCTEIIKGELARYELDELSRSSGSQLLEKPVSEALTKMGLEPVKIQFSCVGEFGPGAFTPGQQGGGAYDPARAQQMREMAESMRAAQMQRVQAMQQMMAREQQRAQQASGTPPQQEGGSRCPSCNTPNPPGSKFCNSCGKPLAIQGNNPICSSCGKPLSNPTVKFCSNCGAQQF